jgi:hypothetical protein
MSIDIGEREAFVTTLLDDVVLHLIDTSAAPHGLARYLVASLRNRARNLHRDVKQSQTSLAGAYSRLGETQQLVVAEAHSEYAIRSAAPSVDEPPLRTAIAKLAERSAAVLTEEDMRLMVAVGRHMPLREFAEQNGMSYANARVRLHRLRARFEKLTAQCVETLDVTEKREVDRFLRRAGVRHAEPAATKQARSSSQYDHKPEETHGHT